ncbi:uncharacterized protein LOC134206621 [Armigeres subalbatus]|uniref:uncharacterized protein LOC134206621 n=1 Tax=Armigeres subalbatus TaxID=124917 RepID=UPI002ED43FC1
MTNAQARINAKQDSEDTVSHRSGASKMSIKRKQLQLELQMLDEERKIQEQQDAKKLEYIHKRYNLLMEIASETSSVADLEEEEEEAGERINNWINDERNIDQVAVKHPAEPAIANPTISRQRSITQHNPRTINNIYQTEPSIRLNRPIVPEFRRLRIREEDSSAHMAEDSANNLTHSQVVARQAVSRELPAFSGTPEEWPLFLSSFMTTTNMCGYTPEENLVRLQKCLKGKAHEAVKCLLMHPSNVSQIISTLKMRFGNPEVIIHNLMAKISSTPAPKIDKLDTIIEYALAVQNLCATIEACQLDEYTYNVALLRELVDKLPSSIKFDWARHRRNVPCTNLSTFSVWLYELAETICPLAALPSETKSYRTSKNNPVFVNTHSEDIDEIQLSQPSIPVPHKQSHISCSVCKGSCTSVEKCRSFVELSYNSKWATLKELGLCRKCLKKHNGPCRSQQICGKNGCEFKHHRLLHNSQRDVIMEPSTRNESDCAPKDANMTGVNPNITESECNIHHKATNKVLFRVVPVILYGPKKRLNTFAFLDDGSSLSFIDAALATELNIEGLHEPLCLKWTANKCRMENESRNISLQISGIEENHKICTIRGVHTVSSLELFHQTVNMQELEEKYQHLRGIPIASYQDVQPRLLIGINNANLSYPIKGREGQMYEPIASKTRLGWVIHGGSEENDAFLGYHSIDTCSCNGDSSYNLGQAMREYFSLEGLGILKPEKPLLSKDNERALQILSTITQTNTGHYETPLLWKYDDFRLPNSKPVALKRYHCLETRMRKDPELAAEVRAKIDNFQRMGYIRKLTEGEENDMKKQRVWYIPMFPVFNPNKPGKTRIVWDWAAKTNGISLNSMLMKGPDQVVPLNEVLYKFRENKVGISGDIREMFLQVLIAKKDQYCQLILWKENQTDELPSTFVTQVMTFGACCSPSCAQYIKNMNAEKHAAKHPRAVESIVNRHYVDDMLDSVETEEEAIQLAKEVRFIHAQAGFEIRNWLSNSSTVLHTLNQREASLKSLNVGSELGTEKVLGMWWCTKSDNFTYKLSSKHAAELLAGERKPTKREFLRTLMSIFDPLGLLSNLLIFLKVLFQEIWRASIDWDDEIPDNLQDKWELWLRILPKVEDVSIPRCYRSLTAIGPNTLIQMHTFVDASELGYAAVVYLRFQQGSVVECSIVGAKSRVAPLKFVSIPRLELQSAVIGARLANTISKALSFQIHQHFYWTDARDVLCWLRSDHRRYSPFVGWRVSEILETTEIRNWKWISSRNNVADEATKWSRNPNLNCSSRWFRGPEFCGSQATLGLRSH